MNGDLVVLKVKSRWESIMRILIEELREECRCVSEEKIDTTPRMKSFVATRFFLSSGYH
jgi:hypothetical protein